MSNQLHFTYHIIMYCHPSNLEENKEQPRERNSPTTKNCPPTPPPKGRVRMDLRTGVQCRRTHTSPCLVDHMVDKAGKYARRGRGGGTIAFYTPRVKKKLFVGNASERMIGWGAHVMIF